MKKENKIKEVLRTIVKEMLEENQPAPSKPKTSPGPAVAPGKPGEKPGPRRPLGNPNVKPKPKAMNEDEMLDKIVKRFSSKKMNEAPKTWGEGYEEGYKDGFKDAKNGKSSKF